MIFTEWYNESWAILLLILGIFGLIALGVFLLRKFILNHLPPIRLSPSPGPHAKSSTRRPTLSAIPKSRWGVYGIYFPAKNTFVLRYPATTSDTRLLRLSS